MFKPALAIALLFASAASAQAACPVINAQFEHQNSESSTTIIGLYTKQEGGKISYNFDVDASGPFLEADGVLKDFSANGETGKIRVSCTDSSVTFEAQIGAHKGGVRLDILSATEIRQTDLEGIEPSRVFKKK